MPSHLYMHRKKVFFALLNHSCQYASNVHNYTTRYVANQNLHKFRVKTNTGKQMISFMAIDLWQEIPKKFKDLNQFAFSKCVNNYICSISAISNVILKVLKLCSMSAITSVIFHNSLALFFSNPSFYSHGF